MPGPGSVRMTDVEASDSAPEDYSDDLDSGGAYSSDNDEADMGLTEAAPRGSKDGAPPYRIIDADLLKQVQVRVRCCRCYGRAAAEVAATWPARPALLCCC